MDLRTFIRTAVTLKKPAVYQGLPPGPMWIVAVLHHKDGGALPRRNTTGLLGFMPVFQTKEDAADWWGDTSAVHELLPYMVQTPEKWR